MDWLDTQTKAHLDQRPPDRLAPPVVDGYSLILLERGTDREWIDHVLESLVDEPKNVLAKCPFVVRRNLSLEDALETQFELICTDSISIFIDDNVVQNGSPSYLAELLGSVRKSEEFEPVKVHLNWIPDTEDGKQFMRQFFGQVLGLSATYVVPRKKARIMVHWGSKLGAVLGTEG